MWKQFFAMFAGVALAGVVTTAARLEAQNTPNQSPAAQSPEVPQWQTDAGGKMAFDVASVKPVDVKIIFQSGSMSLTGPGPHTNIGLGDEEGPAPPGGYLSATFRLLGYINFAYKLSPNQNGFVLRQMPKWANTSFFAIEARASGNPTLDQMRLMMQSLLADRFKLAVHFETRQLPVYALVLAKPGKTGPGLTPHVDDTRCGPTFTPSFSSTSDPWPFICNGIASNISKGRLHTSIRDMTMGEFASHMPGPMVDSARRPILDHTGLVGKFDLKIEYIEEFNGAPPPNFEPDTTGGPTYVEALRDQLGLKLVPTTGPVNVLMIDRVEEPTPN